MAIEDLALSNFSSFKFVISLFAPTFLFFSGYYIYNSQKKRKERLVQLLNPHGELSEEEEEEI
jgi:hypothetical protein